MRRIVMFKDHEKPAYTRLNDWLIEHPDMTLVDIKPVLSGTNTVTIYAIVEKNTVEKNKEGERE